MNLKDVKQGAEFTGWLRAPAAERFLKDLEKQVDAAQVTLVGACSVSVDPAVRSAHAAFKSLAEMFVFLSNAKRESSTEDDE